MLKPNRQILAWSAAALGFASIVACFLPWRVVEATGDLARYARTGPRGDATELALGFAVMGTALFAGFLCCIIARRKEHALRLQPRTVAIAATALFALGFVLAVMIALDDWYGYRSFDSGTMNKTRGLGLWLAIGLQGLASAVSYYVVEKSASTARRRRS